MIEQEKVQWADPMGAASLLIACLCVAAWSLFSGLVPASATPTFMAQIFAFGVAFLIIAIICFRRGDVVGGTLNVVFGSIFGLSSGISGIVRFGLPYFFGSITRDTTTVPIVQISPQLDGFVVFTAAVSLLFMSILIARVSWALTLWAIALVASFGMAAIWMIQGCPGVTKLSQPIQNGLINTSGWFFLVCGVFQIYYGTATIVNNALGKRAFPIGGPLVNR